jgi:protocatechuate 3,4-dioxygenase alpha subunit
MRNETPPPGITPSQTVGPFPHEAWRWAVEASAAQPDDGPCITIRGVVHDGDGFPIDDAQIEAWLPGAAECEQAHALPGFRRVPSDETGSFMFAVPRAALTQPGAPAAFITVFARGLVLHQFTAVFLEDDPGLGDAAILMQVPEERRATLIAAKQGDGTYRWDIWMQSDKETVFFDYA